MTTITRRIEFDAGHRVLGHEGKCRHIHGHRYTAEITATAEALDSLSRVIDFGAIKKRVGNWIDVNWDHNFICHEDDPIVKVPPFSIAGGILSDEFLVGRKPFIMDDGQNPTVEAMAKVLFDRSKVLLLETRVQIVRVRLYETPNCWADYEEQG